MTTWKALNGQAPEYIKNLIKKRQPERNLRSSDEVLLKVTRSGDNNKMVDRAFSRAGAKLWKSIPEE